MPITMVTIQHSGVTEREGLVTCDNLGTKHAERNNGLQETQQPLLVTVTPTVPSTSHKHSALVAIAAGDHMSSNTLQQYI